MLQQKDWSFTGESHTEEEIKPASSTLPALNKKKGRVDLSQNLRSHKSAYENVSKDLVENISLHFFLHLVEIYVIDGGNACYFRSA